MDKACKVTTVSSFERRIAGEILLGRRPETTLHCWRQPRGRFDEQHPTASGTWQNEVARLKAVGLVKRRRTTGKGSTGSLFSHRRGATMCEGGAENKKPLFRGKLSDTEQRFSQVFPVRDKRANGWPSQQPQISPVEAGLIRSSCSRLGPRVHKPNAILQV